MLFRTNSFCRDPTNRGDEIQERRLGECTTEQNMGPVLIVEDDPDIAESLRYGLESAEFETRVAHTGEEGLSESLNSKHPPVLILLDLLLPGMSGAEICRRLRLEPSTQRTPIIIISARASATDIAVGLSAGADDYIGKPFSNKGRNQSYPMHYCGPGKQGSET